MKERIIDMLKAFSDEESLINPNPMFSAICEELQISPQQLQRKSKNILKHIIHNYGAFDISTIDGFTHRIIRTFAHDLKLSINFEVELDQDRLLNEAVDRLISKAGTNETLTKILVDFAIEKADDDKSWDISYDFNKIATLLVNETDLSAISALKEKSFEDFKNLKQIVTTELKTTEKQIQDLANNTLNLISEAGLEYSDFSRSTLPNHFLKASKLNFKDIYKNQLEENLESRKNLYSIKLDHFLIDTIEALLPQIEENYKHQKSLVYQFKFLKAIQKNITPLSVLNAIQNELVALKQEQNKILISEFNTIISEEIKDQPTPFIYERLGEKFKHFFIDEFQDTSSMQWKNLLPLLDNTFAADQGSVMLVGDAKQAIYRWRGGKAEQFINLYNKTTMPFQLEAEILDLDTNFRSGEEIIRFNNLFFTFLGANYFSNPDYGTIYKNASQNFFSASKGFVNLNFLEIDKTDDPNEKYATQVLETIKHCTQQGFDLDDMCILVRKRKEGVAIANYLVENGIKITSSETLLLKNSEKVNFIQSFLKLLVQPDNNNLKVDILCFIASRHHISDVHQFLITHLKPNLNAMLNGLKHLSISLTIPQLLQMPLFDLVEEVIRAFKLNTASDAYLQFYMDVILEYTQKQNSDIAAFIDYFENKQDTLSIVSPENQDAVHIMTIHKSKGLEFPVVIFPFADLNIYSELEPKVWFPVDEKDYQGFKSLLISYNQDVEFFGNIGKTIYNAHQSQIELDHINLLYVALTRPVEALYIISKLDFNSKNEVTQNTFSGMFISYLQHLGLWNDSQLSYTFGKLIERDNITQFEEDKIVLKYMSTPKETHNLSIITKGGLLWDTQQEKAIERGNLIHLILSKIKSKHDVDFALNDLLTSGAISNATIADFKTLVLNVISHPKLKSFFEDTDKIYNEHDIILNSGELIRPDRLNINANNDVYIIDYKTGIQKETYAKQLNTYEAVLNQMNLKVVKKLLVYINDSIEVIEV